MIATKNYIPKVVTGLAVGLACGTTAFAQSSDALIDKLVEKGVLSVKEANSLRQEADNDFTKAYSAKNGMPDWVNSLKLNGDFRGRYEYMKTDNGNQGKFIETRDRFRYRARFGATAMMSDNFEVGLRLGSGEDNKNNAALGGDPLSPNTTLDNNATRKFVFIDLAYAKWSPAWGEIQFGKMQNQFWASPMIFDGDYNPEGAQEKLKWALNDNHSINFSSGQWVIDENTSTRDVFAFVNQVDWTAKWNKKFSTRAGLMMYNFVNQGATGSDVTSNIDTQNGTPLTGPKSQNFNPIIARADATYTLDSFPMYKGEFPITVSTEYVNNPGADERLANGYGGKQNEAWDAGLTLGSAKTKGNWQVGYAYRNMETASLWKGFVDSDFGYGGTGGTDVRGHVITASYKLLNPLTLNFSCFLTEQINNTPKALNEQTRFQVDALWSF